MNTKILDLEAKGCFDFFWNETTVHGKGYGLIRDNITPMHHNMASLASVGYGLTAIPIGVERGWITYEQGYERAVGTLKTLRDDVEHVEGFFYHFVEMNSGKRFGGSEVSIIDTAIAIMGALTAAEYFEGEVKELFEMIYQRVNWEWYRDKDKNMFCMGYWPERQFDGWWDLYAEQFMMYFLGVASPTHPVNKEMFYDFGRKIDRYQDYEMIYTHTGSIFTYQFSLALLDLRQSKDRVGVDWFENSKLATLANRQYCIDNPKKLKTYNKNAWGMTACETPFGYDGGQGALPATDTTCSDKGTIPPCGPAGSIVFTPEESIEALNYFYETFPQLFGKYGFYDAYNLEVSPAWFSETVIGIDKGITLLMIENYRSELVWKLTMKNKYMQKAVELLEFSPAQD
ncbi:MAG: glucoamylase family protein [Turicibacter sp.]